MATPGINPTKIRTPTFQSHKPISNFTSLAKLTKILLSTSQFSTISPPNRLFRYSSVSESSVSAPLEAEKVDEEDDPTSELSYLDQEVDPASILEWELDFCSRPILDIRGKKIWELVVCDRSLSLQYTKYFPNNVINSITLKDAIVSISDELGVPLPDKVRYFRSQMQTIITKACNELGIKPVPSKRCLSLLLWLEERYETVYIRHPGFQKGAKPLLVLDNPFPMELPENLFGEKWAFVQLPFSVIQQEASSLETRYVFGASIDLDLLGIDIDGKTLIPGLAVASSRAKPLAGILPDRSKQEIEKSLPIGVNWESTVEIHATQPKKYKEHLNLLPAWMNGLEVCSIETDVDRACLILAVGISTRYVYATYRKTPETTNEAEAWEAAKKACGGLHFLAIQEDLDSDDCVGFWLLLDLPPPPP